MTAAFERLHGLLKQLPGLGYRSAERIALHLLVERPERMQSLIGAMAEAARAVGRCEECSGLCEGGQCAICQDPGRDRRRICVVEQVPDLVAIERSGAFRGVYHVLHGKLAPVRGQGPDSLNIGNLAERMRIHAVEEVILAMGNDIEGEATCHYLQETLLGPAGVRVSRIGFGLPSGGGINHADAITLRNALDGRRSYR